MKMQLPPQVSASEEGVLSYLLTLALGAIGGSVGTFVAIRTRLALMGRDIKDVNTRIVEVEREWNEKFQTMERRSLAQLRLTASIARKVGADARFDDALIRMLGED